MMITDIVKAGIEHTTRRNYALPPCQQVLVALQYYATGTFQYVVGDPSQMSPQTSWQAIHHVAVSLAGHSCQTYHSAVNWPLWFCGLMSRIPFQRTLSNQLVRTLRRMVLWNRI